MLNTDANIFDEIDENLFRPLTGLNKRKYADLLAIIWDRCKRMPMYAIEKSTVFDVATEMRLLFMKELSKIRIIRLDIEKEYPSYADRYDEKLLFLFKKE